MSAVSSTSREGSGAALMDLAAAAPATPRRARHGAGVPIVPQLVARAGGGFNLLRRAPPIENLVLSGGGAKAVGLGGALAALRDAGRLDHLRAIAGSSAGALVGTWLSVGASMDELGAVLTGNLRELLTEDERVKAAYPDIAFPATAPVVATLLSPMGASHSTATALIRRLDEVTSREVKAFVEARGDEGLHRDLTACVVGWHRVAGETVDGQDTQVRREVRLLMRRLHDLAADPDFTRSRADKMVTFSDLWLLRALAPDKFKYISMSVHDTGTGRNVTFDRHSTPSVPLAYAARASMALPLLATGVAFPHLRGPHAGRVFSDGGLSCNVPVEALVPPAGSGDDRSPARQRLHAATAVMVFSNEGMCNRIMHDPPGGEADGGLGSRAASRIRQWAMSTPHYKEDMAADEKRVRDFGPDVFNVPHGDLTTIDVDADAARKRRAFEEARADTSRQIDILRGDLVAFEVDSVAQAFDLLDEEEKALLRDMSAGNDGSAQAQLVETAVRKDAPSTGAPGAGDEHNGVTRPPSLPE